MYVISPETIQQVVVNARPKEPSADIDLLSCQSNDQKENEAPKAVQQNVQM